MAKDQIKRIIDVTLQADGLMPTGIPGVQLFRATHAVPCAPAVYEPSVIAIVSGSKEAILDGAHHVYDSDHYLCCPMSMPVKAGTPAASPDNPLLGVYIALDNRMMTELAIEMEAVAGPNRPVATADAARGIKFARWDAAFSEALLRLLRLLDHPTDMAILGASRLRELHYAILNGDAGHFARRAFGAGNAIARSIAHVSSHLSDPISIDDMAAHAGMSRAVFHRKFKEATTLSPIQFVKSMRLNNAAMKIASGAGVNQAAFDVGYVSPSQFSREFKRMYGQSPKQWAAATHMPNAVA